MVIGILCWKDTLNFINFSFKFYFHAYLALYLVTYDDWFETNKIAKIEPRI